MDKLWRRKKRRMTTYEKREEARLKRRQKEARKIRKKVASTLVWSHIFDITENAILLQNGKKTATVMGVKLSPHDIFIDDPEEQIRISELAIVNQL